MRPAAADVVVTGMGAVCAVAHDCAALDDALDCGVDGIRPIRRFSTEEFLVHTGAEVPDWAVQPSGGSAAWGLCRQFAVRAAEEAVSQAGLTAGPPRDRIGFVLGTSLGDLDRDVHELAQDIAQHLGVAGPVVTISTACSSSTAAIGIARDLLAMDGADAVIAGGADVLSPEVFAGFHALGVLSPGKCAPFSEPFGTTLGEGAGFLILERAQSARTRNIESIATISGYGLSADAHHETSPDPKGGGVHRAVRSALADASLQPSDIGYVNAHGSGTEANDPSEWRGIRRALGGNAAVPVSSTKGAIGHAQGAAGALEVIVTILTMKRGLVAPTLHFVGPRRFAPSDPVAGVRPRPATYDHALCLNSAFGGSNAALVVSRRPPLRTEPRRRRPVEILGVGLVGPFGLVTGGLGADGLSSGGRVPDFAIERVVPRADPRGLDPMSRFLTAAAALSLEDAGVRITGRIADRTGLIAGAVRPSEESVRAFSDSVTERGLRHLSAHAFARIVLNAPAGFCSKLLSLRGPLAALSVGCGSGLAAALVSAEILSTRDDTDLMIAAGVDELGEAGAHGERPAEGAACLLMGRDGIASRDGRRVRVAGWSIAGPGGLGRAIERVCKEADCETSADHVFDERDYTSCSARPAALPSALACAAATMAIRRGEIDHAWVVSDVGRSMSGALLLTA
ncbi:MAG: beta-ketoacyl synthase N-terminal-like domain-containing protein [Gemmatimonadales bacterium]